MPDEFDIHSNKRTDRLYASKVFPGLGGRIKRFVSKVSGHPQFEEVVDLEGELVLHRSEGGRQELVALISRDPRRVEHLVIQRFKTKDGKPTKIAVSFSDQQIDELVKFIGAIRTFPLDAKDRKFTMDEEALSQVELPDELLKKLMLERWDSVRQLVENNVTSGEVTALAYRKSQLELFERLLSNGTAFEETKRQWNKRKDEDVWQHFFEQNPWIFGFGLNYITSSGLDDKKLEQVVAGYDFSAYGKRVDGLLKSRGAISSLSFVEIKTHLTPLVSEQAYRSGTWAVSDEVAGGVAQIQKTVQQAAKRLESKIALKSRNGDPTGEQVFLFEPRSYLIVGCLKEFVTPQGVNDDKFSSFELFRRNLHRPEILTFDELYERARFIVETSEKR